MERTITVDEILAIYEKKYKKVRLYDRISVLVLVVIFMLYFISDVIMDSNMISRAPYLYIIAFIFVILVISLIRGFVIKMFYTKASQSLIDEYFKKGDIEFVYWIMMGILTYRNHKKDRSSVALVCINTCFSIGKYDEMEQLYETYRDQLLDPYYRRIYGDNLIGYASTLPQPNALYEELYHKRKAPKVRNKKIKNQRQQDIHNYEMNIQAIYAYHHGQYDTALNLLEACIPISVSETLSFDNIKAKCYLKLLRLDDANIYIENIKKENPAYAIVKNIDYVVSGHDQDKPTISEAFIQRWVNDLDINQKNLRKKVITGYGILLAMMVFLFFMIFISLSTQVPNVSYTNIMNAMNYTKDYQAVDEYLTFDIGNEHVGLVKSKRIDEDKSDEPLLEGWTTVPTLRICEVVTDDNLLSKVYVDGYGIFGFEERTILSRALQDGKHTYVVIEGDLTSIKYGGVLIEDVQQEAIVGLITTEIYVVNAFIVDDPNFDESKLTYELYNE